MEAGMGTTARARKGAGANNQIRGIASTAFIDVNYETPINSNQQQQQQQNQQPQQPMPQQPMGYLPQQHFMGYPQQGGYPPQGYNPQMNNSQMFMNPQMNLSSNSGFNPQQQQQQQMYNTRTSSLVSVGQYSKQKVRQRRNSNSSMTSMSVNKFVKKQWGKIGGGGGGGDDDGDGKIEMETSENEISFDDLQHIRNGRPGFGLTDTTPYIPTLKTKMSGNASNVSGEQYRKMQMAQKKAMAMNMARQNKQPQPQQQQMMGGGPPRSMSLQSYGNGYSPFNPMMNGPPSNGMMMSGGMPPNGMMINGPPNGMVINGPPNGMMMNGPPNSMMMPIQQQQQQSGMMMGANPYMTGGNPSNPSFNPRAMSLQSDQQRNFQMSNPNINPLPNRQPSNATPPQFTSNTQQFNESSPPQQQSIPQIPPPASAQPETTKKRTKTVNKIDFSPVSAEDEDDDANGIAEHIRSNNVIDRVENDPSPINQDLLPTLPAHDEISSQVTANPVKRTTQHQVSRSVADSIVSFDSVTQKEQKSKQDKLYHLRNNSSQKTIFYSASEFQVNGSQDNSGKSDDDSKQKLATHSEAIAEEESLHDQPININTISESLDKLVLNGSPNPNQSAFANNYGSYGNEVRESIDSYKSAESTQPLHLAKKITQKTIDEDVIETSSPIKNTSSSRETITSLSPTKTEDSKNNYIDMTVSLNSQSKEASPSKNSIISNSRKDILGKQNEPIVYKRQFTPPSSAVALIGAEPLTADTSVKSSPTKIRLIESPRTPISLNSSNRHSFFTPEQYGLLNDNTQLLQELELVTTELASSVSREIVLEDNLRKSSRILSKDDLSMKRVSSIDVTGDDTITQGIFKTDGKSASQYAATISSLTKQLNEERKRRYLVEEMLLKVQEDSTTAEIESELLEQKSRVGELTDELNNMADNVKLHQTEKDLLNSENNTLKLKIEELETKYDYLDKSVVPRLKNQVEMLENMLQNAKTSTSSRY